MSNQLKSACKKLNQEPEESGVKLNDLPVLPFEKILGYLSLKDRITSRTVSSKWCTTIDGFKVKSICYSDLPNDFILGKARWVSGAFAQNFIRSASFGSFFNAFDQSIHSNLKKIRLCDFYIDRVSQIAFAQTLNSFDQLKTLDIIRLRSNMKELRLDLPMLTDLTIEEVSGVMKLTLDAPRLWKLKLLISFPPELDIVHGELVETLLININLTRCSEIKTKLKNLKYLYLSHCVAIDSTFVSGLEHLREFHLKDRSTVSQLLEQKQRYNRTDLEIFYRGCLLDGPHDPAIDLLSRTFGPETIEYLVEHPSKLANKIPGCTELSYTAIEAVPPESAMNLLKRYTDLNEIIVDRPVQDTECFLDFLKTFSNITVLQFKCDQPQALLNRLPEHCDVQQLTFIFEVPDLRFLLKLNHMIRLELNCSVDIEKIRKVLKKLQFIKLLQFAYLSKKITVDVDHPKRIRINGGLMKFSDVDAVIQFIIEYH